MIARHLPRLSACSEPVRTGGIWIGQKAICISVAAAAGLLVAALHAQIPVDPGVTVDIATGTHPTVPRHLRPAVFHLSARHERAERNLAAMLLGECRGQSIVCMQMVGHVALNRAAQKLPARYGDGLYGVIRKRAAFSCMLKLDNSWKVVEAALAGKLPPHSPDGIMWTMAQGQAHILMHRWSPDPTHGATYYAATFITPVWIHDRGMVRTVKADGHVFYAKKA